MKCNLFKTCVLLFALSFIACGKEGPEGPAGPAGNKSLLDIANEPAGEHCLTGGIRIQSGVDKNNNNILDADEVDNTKFVCNGGQGGYDKQIVLQLARSPINSRDTIPTVYRDPNEATLVRFNKNNFVGVDSVVLYTRCYAVTGNTATVQLWNVTDNVPIANSTLVSDKEFDNSTNQETGNLYHFLPDKEITLGFAIRSAKVNVEAGATTSYLILYRK